MSHEPTTVVQGGRVVTADGEYDADVLIAGEQIAAVGDIDAPAGANVVDVSGCLRAPRPRSTTTRTCRCRSWACGRPTTTTRARRRRRPAASRASSTSRSSASPTSCARRWTEWQGRAAGAAHVDYGFHMAITNANEPTIDDMGAMVEAGVVELQAVHGLQGRAHDARRRARRRRWSAPATSARWSWSTPRTATSSTCWSGARWRAGDTVGDPPRAHAAGVRRGRGDRRAPRGWPSTRARRCSSCT